MPPRALTKSMSTHTMVFMAGSTPPCTTPAPSHPVFLAHLLVAQVPIAQPLGLLATNGFYGSTPRRSARRAGVVWEHEHETAKSSVYLSSILPLIPV